MSNLPTVTRFVVGVLLLSTGRHVQAGPICHFVEQKTLSEEFASAKYVALATVEHVDVIDMMGEAGAVFTVKAIAKPRNGKGNLKVGDTIAMPRFKSGKTGDHFILFGVESKDGFGWGTSPGSEAAFKYVAEAPAPNLKPAERIGYFARHLGASDDVIGADVVQEIRRADFDEVRAAKVHIPSERVRRRIRDPKCPDLERGVCCWLLGLCGDGSDEQMLKGLLDRVAIKNDTQRVGYDLIMSGYLMLAGERGLEFLEANRIQNPKAAFVEVYMVIQALRFMWNNANGKINRQRLRQSMRMVLNVKSIRDIAIHDLVRWKDWDAMDRMVADYPDDKLEWNRASALRAFLVSRRAFPEPRTDTQSLLRAVKLLDEASVKEPKLYRKALLFSTTAYRAQPDKDKLVDVEATRSARKRMKQIAATVFDSRDEITEINANRTTITDDDLKLIAPLRHITDLSLEKTVISDAGLENLADLPVLEWLNLYQTKVGDAGLKHIARFKKIKLLPIGETNVTDKGLAALEDMPQLTYLGLKANKVTDEGMVHLRGLKNLTGLHLGETKISDKGLQSIANAVLLERLWLDQTSITDRSVPLLSTFTKLSELHIVGTKITPAGLAKLKRAMPKCEIVSTGK